MQKLEKARKFVSLGKVDPTSRYSALCWAGMDSSLIPGDLGRSTDARVWLRWTGAAVVAAPIAIVLHEFGHFAAAEAFGFPDVRLRYASVSDGAADGDFPAWQQGVKSIAGPIATLVLVLGSLIAARRFGPRPIMVALAFAAGVRPVALGGAYFLFWMMNPEAVGTPNVDELNAGRYFGMPANLVMGTSMLLILGAWIYLAILIPGPVRWKALVATAFGIIVGIAAWVLVIGPLLLP